MLIRFSYEMRIDFSCPVTGHHYSLKCLPTDTARQRVKELSLSVSPTGERHEFRDFWGSDVVYGYLPEPHRHFFAVVEGVVETGLDIFEEYDENTDIYSVQSSFTKPGTELSAFYSSIKQNAPEDGYARLTYFSKCIHEHMQYITASTDIRTTAEQAFENRCGVCQDYAHILISLLRMDGIPARYVVGIMAGEGESHAWVEANLKGYWYGIDPTNDLLTDNYYIKISHGRDYRDCIVSKGVFYGMANQKQTVSVSASEVEEV